MKHKTDQYLFESSKIKINSYFLGMDYKNLSVNRFKNLRRKAHIIYFLI